MRAYAHSSLFSLTSSIIHQQDLMSGPWSAKRAKRVKASQRTWKTYYDSSNLTSTSTILPKPVLYAI